MSVRIYGKSEYCDFEYEYYSDLSVSTTVVT